ncbi:RNA-directed DNA polymerase [Pseudoprevotella muciniphila]|uniref:RNA-directed DNA polymerase n=1 Tax=Pseudoprevotella muciniphila TaxID=2133944 RepID=A0A5P8E9M7_9BACT|nr:reverse transcriptase domain-containing protein [Pseudoprevotella muciniphila]QFQ13570.1 RNA-directed DNA polymerase [Pseudoprevotella muciniphila]
MEKAEIRDKAMVMKTTKNLARLLNTIKQEEFGSKRYKITPRQLYHFAYTNIAPNRYKTFHIHKKSGGLREINAPCYQLGIILYFLNKVFKSLYTPSSSVTGFTEGRSVYDNAKMHVGHHYVFNIDLKDFFPSISQGRVWTRLQLPPFNFTQEIANVVAGLCCHKNAGSTLNVLPQGAATSPILTNAVCDKLDRRMRGVAKRFGLHYSRYADDMTFSSMHNVYQEGSEFRCEVKRIIEEQGFQMNDAKTRLLRDGVRQEVTGLTVNSVVNVSRKYISDLRWIIRVWEKEGYAKAYSKFYPKYKKEKGYIKKGEPIMENVIGGKLNYLKMIRGENNPAYKKLQERYNRLQQVVYVDNETDKGTSYVYVQSYTMKEFQKYFATTVTLEVSAKGKLVGKCLLAGMEKIIPISLSTQKKLCPDLESKKSGEQVISKMLTKCHVTLCRAKGKNFWLITKYEPKRSKCFSIQNTKIDIDTLLNIWEQYGTEGAVDVFQQSIYNGQRISKEGIDGLILNFILESKYPKLDTNKTQKPQKSESETLSEEEMAQLSEFADLIDSSDIDELPFTIQLNP